MKHVIKKNKKKKPDEKKGGLINELVDIFVKLEFEVRIEKGMFKGGFCLLKTQRLFLLNKNLEQDKKITYLLRNLAVIGIDGVYVKPGIREMIENEAGAMENSGENSDESTNDETEEGVKGERNDESMRDEEEKAENEEAVTDKPNIE